MTSLRVLLTNENLTARGGAALYVRDVALALLRKGHRPVVYSPQLGELANELRSLTIPVVSNLNDLAEAPDVIHGQNHHATMIALLHFPHSPAINVCHGWMDAPVRFPRVLRYVAVDEVCYDHLVLENGISPDKVSLVLNFADLERFKPRASLPEVPRRALIFSNGVSPGQGLEAIQEACTRAGLTLDSLGYGMGAGSSRPEEVLGDYDIVFAKARCAIEALAVGCSVITADVGGMAGMVTTENLDTLRRLNFGWRSLARPLDPGALFEEIRSYSAQDATRVARKMRDTASLRKVVDQLLQLYQAVITEYRRSKPDLAAEQRAVAAYLASVTVPPAVVDVRVTQPPVPPAPILGPPSGNILLTPIGLVPLKAFEMISGHIISLTDDEAAPARSRKRRQPASPDVEEAPPSTSLKICTASFPWHFAAALRLGEQVPEDMAEHAGVVRLRFRVTGGSIGVGVLNTDGSDWLTRQVFGETPAPIDLLLRLARFDEAGQLVLQTWDKPTSALVEIELVEIYAAGGV